MANKLIQLSDGTNTLYPVTRPKQEGVEQVTGNSSGWVYKTVTFSTPFNSTPLVAVSLYEVTYATDWVMPMLRNVTKNGFTMGWYKASGTKDVYWQAIGS